MSTQVLSSVVVACTEISCDVGQDDMAMLVSRTSRNAAREMATSIAQGLTLGAHTTFSAVSVADAVLIADKPWPQCSSRGEADGHVLTRFQHNLDVLDMLFHEVARAYGNLSSSVFSDLITFGADSEWQELMQQNPVLERMLSNTGEKVDILCAGYFAAL